MVFSRVFLRILFPLCFVVLICLTVSSNAKPNTDWRSKLYPEDWTPSHRDASGRFLHDFSYAGYHYGRDPIPDRTDNVIDVTRPPYSADPSGRLDSTAAIQSAIDTAATAPDGRGGIVYLPPGTYLVAPPPSANAAIRIHSSNIILRGAGADRTFILNDSTEMRERRVIEIAPRAGATWAAEGRVVDGVPLTLDAFEPALVIRVADAKRFGPGDTIVVRPDLTQGFIDLVGMSGKWAPAQSPNRTLAYYRRIIRVDAGKNELALDVPVRGLLRVSDNARVISVPDTLLQEVGLEDFSIGMRQHPSGRSGRDEELDYTKSGTLGYDAHLSTAIQMSFAENSWIRRIRTFAATGNDSGIHVLSNALRLWRSRLVTVAECDLRHPQYRGGGGNGYLYIQNGQDNLVRDCHAENGRHNYDFGTMLATGNVILDSMARNGRMASDFHMFLSAANLLDNVTCDGDFLEARAFRPWGGNPVHGVTTTQSVFWRTHGLAYPSKHGAIVHSHQQGEGYVIGTWGPASRVDSSDYVEGVGQGESLVPRSLYLDQLARRLATSTGSQPELKTVAKTSSIVAQASVSETLPTPVRKAPPLIVLKLDDFRQVNGRVHHAWLRVDNYLGPFNIPWSIGVLAETLAEATPEYIDWIKARHSSGRIEFWFHGWDHKTWQDESGKKRNEFVGRSFEEQWLRFERSQQLALEKVSFNFTTFGPPGGVSGASYDSITAQAIARDPSMKVWLYPSPINALGKDLVAQGNVAILDRVWAVNLEGKVGVPDYQRFVDGYTRNPERRYFVLQGHPTHWGVGDRFAEFQKIIQFLITQRAIFVTPSDCARQLQPSVQ